LLEAQSCDIKVRYPNVSWHSEGATI